MLNMLMIFFRKKETKKCEKNFSKMFLCSLKNEKIGKTTYDHHHIVCNSCRTCNCVSVCVFVSCVSCGKCDVVSLMWCFMCCVCVLCLCMCVLVGMIINFHLTLILIL